MGLNNSGPGSGLPGDKFTQFAIAVMLAVMIGVLGGIGWVVYRVVEHFL